MGRVTCRVLRWVKNRKNSKKINKMQLHVYRKSIIFSFFFLFFSSPGPRVAQSTCQRKTAVGLVSSGLPRLRAPMRGLARWSIGISTHGPHTGCNSISIASGAVQPKECIRKISINRIYGVWTVSVASLLISKN